jgi:enoyl-CoA hydratase/carnithine racemase
LLIEQSRHGRVLQIALNRPEKRNALNLELCNDLVRAFDQADNDTATGAILLTGNGPAFCAGMDLHEVMEGDTLQLTELHERLFTLINRLRTPVIAAVHGPALAGGTGLAANAHIVIAAPDARFGLPEIRLGLWPVLVFRACALAMGERRATELSLTGRTIEAEEALLYGLVTEITADPVKRARDLATSIAAFSYTAISEGLHYVHQIRGRDWTHAGSIGHKMRGHLMQSEEFRAAAQHFLKK